MTGAANDLLTLGNTPDFSRRNLDGLITGTKTVSSAGTAEVLGSSQAIPSGYALVIKALKANTGKVHIADSAAEAQTDASAYELGAGEAVTLNIDNVNRIYVDANVSGEGVTYIVEKVA